MQEQPQKPEQAQEKPSASEEKIVFQAMPDLNEPVLDEDEAYRQLQQQNRRRLIGAGAATLVVAGLFAAITSGGGNTDTQTASAPALSSSAPAVVPTLTASDPASAPVATADDLIAASAASMPEAASGTDIMEPIDTASLPVEPMQAEPVATDTRDPQQQAQEAAAKAAAQRLAREQAAAAAAARAKQAAEEKRKAEQTRKQQAREDNKPANTATRPAAPTAPAAGKGSLMVQAGAFKTPAQAQKVQKQLQSMGLSARISEVKTDKGTLLRVQAGPFADRAAAEAAAAKMKNSGLGGMVIGK